MSFQKVFLTTLAVLSLCSSASSQETLQIAVDQSFEVVSQTVEDASLTPVLTIDHARLAAAEGVEMPPSRVQLFSDLRVNTMILQQNVRAGLDLPFRVLSYAENGASKVIYTPGSFLAQRHPLTSGSTLSDFDKRIEAAFGSLKDTTPQPMATEGVDRDFAIIELRSQFPVAETVDRLKKAITAQSDTIWFGEIDFQREAATIDVELMPAQLLLFGGPAPGGVAMADFPAIGLDAFCQKLLVYAGEDGKAIVLFNDIAALAELHYGHSAKPHAMLNKRLTETFANAITQ
ncbi:DUF302 domain-containing protein [Roseobacter sp.]|uniref:DUF302 domain-containing protein n=1 Tax=Roseobacter sp. TaxID=1907202 RepID=UPI00385C627B